MKNLLFISVAFPPKNDPECLQTAKYFYYLQHERAFNIDIITSAIPTLFMPYDKNLELYNKGYRSKIEIKINENKYFNYLIRKLFPSLINLPDSKNSFFKSWEKTIKKLVDKPDIIYSRSYPISSTLLAMKMQEYFKVPWVLHLSDPWTETPIHNFNKKEKVYHDEYEIRCFNLASYICVTSEMTLDIYKKKYPHFADKFLYYPNVYDPSHYIENPYVFTDKIKVVFTGGLVESRSVSYLINAMKILEEKNPEVLNSFEFIFAGAMDSYNKSFFENSTFSNLKHLGLLPYNEALDLQRSADVLLVIDNPIDSPEKAVFFPSKLLDYMLMQRNILAITTLGGTTDNLIKSIESISVSHFDLPSIVSALMNIHRAFEEKDKSFFFRNNLNECFSAGYNAKRLVQTLESLLK